MISLNEAGGNYFLPQRTRKSLSPVTYRDANQKIQRVWGHYLPAPAQAIVSMIFDRTFGWSKEREIISLRQIKEGVFSRSGDLIHGGTGLGERTSAKWLSLLVEAGAVFRYAAPAGCGPDTYALNMEWTPGPLPQSKPRTNRTFTIDKAMGLRKPKRLQEGAEPPQKLHPTPAKIAPKERVMIKKPLAKISNPPPMAGAGSVDLGIDDVLGAIARKSEQRKNARLSQTYERVPAQKILGPLFNNLLLESHPDALPLTGKDVVVLSRQCRQWVKATGKPFDEMLAFLRYVVKKWYALRSTNFANMTSFPEHPAVRFIFAGGMQPAFWAAYRDREFLATLEGMHPDHAETALLARRKGITLEEAQTILAPRQQGREKVALAEAAKEQQYRESLGNQTAARRRARRAQR